MTLHQLKCLVINFPKLTFSQKIVKILRSHPGVCLWCSHCPKMATFSLIYSHGSTYNIAHSSVFFTIIELRFNLPTSPLTLYSLPSPPPPPPLLLKINLQLHY